MSERRAGAPQPARARKTPFGAPPPLGEPSHAGTMADAVRRCRWIAVDIAAASFILFFVAPPGDKRRLIFGFDAEFPGQSVLSRMIETRIAAFLRAGQGKDGGWPLFPGGGLDLSCSVKAYFALKAIGDDPDAPHMARARQAILAAGGAARTNVFTRAQLALFGQVPWRAVPVMPLEIMHLPRWLCGPVLSCSARHCWQYAPRSRHRHLSYRLWCCCRCSS